MSMNRYPDMIPSGLSLAPLTPSHWKKTALKFLGFYQNGYPFKPEDWKEDGLPIIRIAQLTGESEPNYFSGDLDHRVRVSNGDLLFSWSATIDSFIWNKGPAWLNQHIFKVTPSIEADKSYLFYLIKHVAPKLADVDAHGSTMRHIKKESLGERIFVPDVAEQKNIALFLDRETVKIDALIFEQEKLIELLKDKRQSVISNAVTKGLDPTVKMKDSGIEWLGDMPAHWSIGSIGYVASIQTGSTPDRSKNEYWNGDIPWVKTGEVNYELILDSEERITEAGLANSAARIAEVGTLMMAMYGQGVTRGRVAILGIRAAYNQACAAITFGPKLFNEYGMYFFMMAYQFIRDTGNETSQMNLGSGTIAKIKILVPPLIEQNKIVIFLQNELFAIDNLITEAKLAIDLLHERRSALISAAVTGLIDVRNVAIEMEAA